MTDAADGEVGIIGPEGAGADEDGIDLGAEAVGIEAGGRAGEPGALRGEAEDAGIEGEGALGDDEGEAGEDPLVEGAIERCGFGGEDARDDLDAGGAEELEAAARVGGIGIGGGDDDAGEAGGDDGIDAGRGAAMGGAGLEGDVEGGAMGLGRAGEAAEGFDLGMGGAGGAVPAAGEQMAAGGDDEGADGGIGTGAAQATAGLAEGEAHPGFVGGHEGGEFRVSSFEFRVFMRESLREMAGDMNLRMCIGFQTGRNWSFTRGLRG